MGKTINDQWLSATMGFCGTDNHAARELAAKSLRTFFGPDRPYLKDQTHLYEQLVESWGGVPDHLRANFARYIKADGPEGAPAVDLSGGSGQIAAALWNQIDADTLVERGVLVAGDPESCLPPSPSTRRPAWTSCSSSWPPSPCPTTRSCRPSRCSAST